MYSFFCLLVADLEVALEEAKCLVGFVDNGVNMGAPFHVVLDVDTRVLCCGDVFNGMSMQLICLFFLLLADDTQCGAFLGMKAQGPSLLPDGKEA